MPKKKLLALDPPSKPLIYVLLSLMAFFWSVNYIAGKVALREFPPLLLGGLRISFAGAMILPIYCWQARRNPQRARWTRTDAPGLLSLGVFGVTLNQLLFIVGLNRTSVAHAALLIGLGPILVLSIAAMMRMERITLRNGAGMLVALAGVALINAAPSGGRRATLIGNLFVFLGSVAFAVFTVFGKRVAAHQSSVLVNTFAYAGGAILLLPLTLWQSAGFDYARVSAAAWESLVFMAAFPSVVCYLIYFWALTHVTASRAAVFTYLQPPMATALAVPLLGEAVTPLLAGGGVLVLAGVYMTERG